MTAVTESAPVGQAARTDRPVDPALAAVMTDLAAVVTANLSFLLTLDQAEALFQRWRTEHGLASALDDLLPDLRARYRFVRALRVLLSEQLPLLDAPAIVKGTASVGLEADLWTVVTAVRARLDIAALVGTRVRVDLSPEVADDLPASPSDVSTTPTEAAWELLQFVRSAAPDDESPFALVVDDVKRRPLVEFLVSRQYPDALVVCRSELGEGSR
jgi:flagellar biosynthesis component FlhA